MRVLVTGASGFLGSRLLAALSDAGHSPVGLASEAGEVAGVPVRALDLRDRDGLLRTVRDADPELVLHLGALSHVGRSWSVPGEYLRVNFDGTRHVLDAASGRRLIFASSAEVYGRVPEDEQPIREDRELDPRSPYAMTKACAESLVLAAGAAVVRSFNIVGPGQAPHFALPSFARQLAAVRRGEKKPILKVGDLSPRRDFTHVDDAIDAFVRIVDAGVGGTTEVFNLASGDPVSIGEALDRLIAISRQEVEIEVDPERVRPVDLPLLCGDASRLRALGWAPRRGLDRALRDLWDEVREPA